MILKPISLTLSDAMLADDTYFPLTQRDNARLLEMIPDGDEMFLTIRDNLYSEWVRAENQCGTIVVHRGVDDSQPRKFPRGSCVFFETSLPVIKWLICNYNCCEGEDCDCVGVTLERESLPTGIVNMPWEGRILFDGSFPIHFSIDGMPSWMKAEYEEHIVRLSGTPTGTGTFTVSISATNCAGTANVVKQHKVVVTTATAAHAAYSEPVVMQETSEEVAADPFQPTLNVEPSVAETAAPKPRRKKS